MITRAQAEALLTLAEALEVCERLEVDASVNIGPVTLDIVDRADRRDMNAVELRLIISKHVPKSTGL